MREFTDNAGRNWKLDINVGAVKRVRESTRIVLPALFDDSFKGLAELAADYIELVDVLWAACQPQAALAGVSAEQFAEGMGGDSLGKATEALARAVADFFTSPEQRQALHKALDLILETAGKMQTLTTQAATTTMENLDTDQLAQSCLDFVTSGQARPASIPIHAPLASST